MSARRPLRSLVAPVAVLLFGVLFSASVQAAPGDLDPTFSSDGRQTTHFSLGPSSAIDTVRQPDGKIVAVGRVLRSESPRTIYDFALARYNPNGSLDTSFSGDGKQMTDFDSPLGASAVALQPNGKIVAVGTAGSHFNDFALARYNPNGSLDTSFSGDGKQTTNFGAEDGAGGVALQDDGKIVVVGGAHDDLALARYNPNGSLDTSFSGDGKQTSDFGGGGAGSLALQEDGRIVVVGSAPDLDLSSEFFLARYTPNGSLDTSFSGDGKQRTNFGGSDGASEVALQTNGKIVVVGAGGPGPGDFALARYTPNGSLDTSFSGDGKQTTDFFGGSDFAFGMALQTNGRIVAVGGTSNSSGVNDFALTRYNTNGSLDTSFSGDGKQTTSFSPGCCDSATSVALAPNGKIFAVGQSSRTDGTSDFAIARYLGG